MQSDSDGGEGIMTENQEQSVFDPGKYLTPLNGKQYLEVKWRLVWLRSEYPTADIKTELVEHRFGEYAVCKAIVTLPNGDGGASGYGSESSQDFRDYLEKAETKAIGRALAALGFGTQFTDDFQDGIGAGANRPVDSPIDFSSTRGRRMPEDNTNQGNTNRGNSGGGGGTWKPSEAQLKFAFSIRDQLNLYEAYSDQKLHEMTGPQIKAFIDDHKASLPPRR